MSDIQSTYSNYARYVLQSNKMPSSRVMETEPGNWNNDDLNLNRHKDYHGMFFSFNEGLVFYGEDMEYILSVYNDGDINANLRLRKDVYKVVGTDTKWVYRYIALADWKTLEESEDSIKLSFNSNNLAELVKSHETDDFELEREDSIDGLILDAMSEEYTEIKGRSLQSTSELQLEDNEFEYEALQSTVGFLNYWTPVSKLVGGSFERIAAVDSNSYNKHISTGDNNLSAINMFYVNKVSEDELRNVSVKYDIDFINSRSNSYGVLDISIVKHSYNENTAKWTEVESRSIYTRPNSPPGSTINDGNQLLSGVEDFEDVTKDESILIRYSGSYFKINKQNIKVNEVEHFESSPKLRFAFVHDVLKRLMYIVTGRNDAFYSKFYGRTELSDYNHDGEGGLIGMMSGLWARNFIPGSTNYKSLTTSIKDVLDSVKAINNIGVTIEDNNFKERLRVEDLKYFYRQEVIVKFPNQVSNLKRRVDSSLFFSGLEFGYERGGDYDNAVGLDEPNTRTNLVTPIRKSKDKFKRLSKNRTDETALEIARRKPQTKFANEDTRYDDSNFFLDLKRTDGLNYTQKDYTDRCELDELNNPILPQNVHSPETYRSMYFSPIQLLKRHAWIFRSGLEKYLSKQIKYINSKSNSSLITWMKGESRAFAENGDITVDELERSRFLPKVITCEYDIDDELMDWILGSTEVIDENGEKEMVPNYYFKMQILNDKNEFENVYLLNLKPGKNGKLEFQSANENLL